jgi:hypothetical protein
MKSSSRSWPLQSSAKYILIYVSPVVSFCWGSSIIVPDLCYNNDIFRKTYNNDRFESVTKPASWSCWDQLARMRYYVSLLDYWASRTFQYTFWHLKFLENFYLYLILCYSTWKYIEERETLEYYWIFSRHNKRSNSYCIRLTSMIVNNIRKKFRDMLSLMPAHYCHNSTFIAIAESII